MVAKVLLGSRRRQGMKNAVICVCLTFALGRKN